MNRTLRRARQAAALILLLFAAPAAAHQLAPSIGGLSFPDGADGPRWRIVFEQVNLEAMIAEIGSGHDDTSLSPKAAEYDRLRALDQGALRRAFDDFAPSLAAGIEVKAGAAALPVEIENVVIPPAGDLAVPRASVISVGGPLPRDAETITFAWSPRFGDAVIRTELDENGEGFSALLTGGAVSEPIPTGRRAGFLGGVMGWLRSWFE